MSDLIAAVAVLAGLILAASAGLLTRWLTRPRTPYQIKQGGRHPYDQWD